MSGKKIFLKSLYWGSSASALTKLVDLASLVVLGRMLDPETFGLVAIALLVTNSLSIFSDFGLGAALIQKENVTNADSDTVFVVTPLINIVIYIIAFLAAEPAARFFNNGDVALIIKVLSLILVIQSFGSVQSALLQKRLEYRKLLIPDILSSIAYFGVAIGMAYKGQGVWSLVAGQLARQSVRLAALWMVADRRPRFSFDWQSFRNLYGFGKHIVVLGLISFVLKNLDNAVIAKLLTPRDLGLYTMAYTIGNLLPQFIKLTIGRIAFPLYSKWNKERDNFKRRFVLINKFNIMFSVWASLMLITLAGILIPAVWGNKWSEIVILIHVLVFFGLQRAIASVCAPALNAMGKPEVQRGPMFLNSLIFVPLLIPVASLYGIKGVSVLASASIVPGFIWLVYRTYDLMGLKDELLNLAYPLLVGGFSLLMWLAMRPAINNLMMFYLVAGAGFMSIIFWSGMWYREKELLRQIWRLREV